METEKNKRNFFDQAARYVVLKQRASVSALQHDLYIGFAMASRLMEELEAAGIVGPKDGKHPQPVLIKDLAELKSRVM